MEPARAARLLSASRRLAWGDRIGDAGWTEVFNSDSQAYGGGNIGNAGATLHGSNGSLSVVLPAAGLVVFRRSDLSAHGSTG